MQKMTGKQWSTAELLDLEFFLAGDEGEDIDRLAARDREIWLGLPAAVKEDKAGGLLRGWLNRRRQTEQDAALPGALWQELIVLFAAAIMLAGLSSGGGLAFSLLAYSGAEPVNVAAYFAVFVLLQLALIFFLTVSVLCGKQRGRSMLESSFLYRLSERLFFYMLERCMAAGQRAGSRLSAGTRLHWAARAGSLKHLRQRHGLLFVRPFFLLAQLFGISFNIGVLAATLLKVIGSDLAFGWQSTLQIDAAAVHALATTISLPWTWLSDAWVPSLEQIQGSRLILKDGIYSLANRDLVSWWPFLCLSVLCYGLLPRLLLLTAGLFSQRKELARLDLQQGCFRQIIQRMRTPLITAAARGQEGRAAAAPLAELPSAAEPVASTSAQPLAALIPEELFADCPPEHLAAQVRRRTGHQLGWTLPFWTLDKSEEEELAALKAAMAAEDSADVLVLQEAWQPPVQEFLAWLGLLRQTLGPQPLIILALLGKPEAETMLTPARPEHLRIWRQKVATISDPALQVIPLVS
ncbi:DUF2868 domain-containing protein [Candidatus Electronema halotolerans]